MSSPAEYSLPERVTTIAIAPLLPDDLFAIAERQRAASLAVEEFEMTIDRGVYKLFESTDYARLPGVTGQSAKDVVTSLPHGSTWLDAGGGDLTFINEVIKQINSGLVPTAIDLRNWTGQNHGFEFFEASLLDIPIILRGHAPFKLITSSAVLYHIPDYLGALLRMIDVLDNDGILLAYALPLVQAWETPGSNTYGNVCEDQFRDITRPDLGELAYFGGSNIVDTKGNLISFSKLVQVLQLNNPGYIFESFARPGEHMNAHEGNISVKKITDNQIDFSSIFYSQPGHGIKEGLLAYIVAANEAEKSELIKNGFVSLQDLIEIQKKGS